MGSDMTRSYPLKAAPMLGFDSPSTQSDVPEVLLQETVVTAEEATSTEKMRRKATRAAAGSWGTHGGAIVIDFLKYLEIKYGMVSI